LRFGLRMLSREPAFTVAAVVVLALGMGASTAIFTLIRAVLLEPLPYPDSSRLVYVWTSRPGSGVGNDIVSADDFREYRERSQSFERIAGYVRNSWTLTDSGEPQRLSGMNVTREFFDTLGVVPSLGRAFFADEFRLANDNVAIVSHKLWSEKFSSDPNILGQRATLDGISYAIVGVMPADFPMAETFDLWAPLAEGSPLSRGRRVGSLRTFGRLRSDAAIERAQAEAGAIGADFAARYPEDHNRTFQLTTFLDFEIGNSRDSLWILAAAVACVLLIACSNVASLLLARGATRVREMAVRAAIGANRVALVRQMLIESTALSIAGGVLGTLLAMAAVRAVVAIAGSNLPRAKEIHADPRMLVFAFALSLATGIVCGLAPAWRGSRVNPGDALKECGRGGSGNRANRLREALVVAEVAFGVALMVSAMLLSRSVRALSEVKLGYDTRGTVTMQVALPVARYGPHPDDIRRFFERVLDGIEKLPGVEAAGSTNLVPLQPDSNRVGVWTDSQPVQSQETKTIIDNRVVTPGYFRAMGVPLLAGRTFDWSDRPETARVAIINDVFAREAFPNGGALGRRITLDLGPPVTSEIVGVVGSFRESSVAEEPRRELFTSESQTTIRGQTLVVRTRAIDQAHFTNALRRVIAQVDRDVPVYNVRTMQQQVSNQLAQPRMRGAAFAAFSLIALVLASLGVAGVIACGVAERRREIGIRMALGAAPAQVRRMLVGEGLKLTAIGLVIGLAAAVAAGRLLRGFLYGISPLDPVSLAVTCGAFAVVALVASYLPARRATKVDPLQELKSE
jgi:putative ABC transport system permease protein